MTKLPGNKIIFLLMCICLPVLVQAQQFRYQCITDTVKQTGFYRIPITPEMSAHMQTDFRDVRILNSKQQQVSYLIRTHKLKWQNDIFYPFPIIDNTLDDSGHSVIVIQKNVNYPIPDLALIINNASVSRYADLSGSNDSKKWFTISEHVLINESYETLTDTSIQTILFPNSNYRYFRLKIFNNRGDPLNIKSIGHYRPYPNIDYHSINLYINNPEPKISQTDSSNGISYVKVLQQQPFRVNQIRLVADGPKYFSRIVSVLIPEIIRNKRQNYVSEISTFAISSGSALQTDVPVFKNNEFSLRINNGDNLPLKIKSVITTQENNELIAWLESGKRYTIMMDADDAVAPTYDLQQFQDSIPATVPTLSVGQINPVTVGIKSDKNSAFPQKWLWLIMAGAVILLAILTWRLTGEMRKKES